MVFNYKKSVTYRLLQAAKAQRARSGGHLMRIGLHPGQELVLKVLADADGRTMSQLALALGVQPPTVTKMVTRLSAQGLVSRQVSESDGRLARVFLTEEGRGRIGAVDKAWKRLEKDAMAGLDDKDRKKLRKLLRHVERNLSLAALDEPDSDGEDDIAAAAEATTEPVALEA
ncbi:MarR family winged helix-turn-helix transcriptional regulator [Polymorphum gilvum]|uniref:Transcriptional regulator, MarR family n=1 Tax=Polymorphum gilvum (strain LMG 25793 / CGMCC 1.9160 / SL003B-26A1) TaxID=991905 RepID=F2IWC9_POLGS|nr:MarR family transcriptional regulator [Polymorphum gilvum]ADZ69228.1 Transcriptional regulator, MarR family [Polymorphum gilvum SL003B-26A1]